MRFITFSNAPDKTFALQRCLRAFSDTRIKSHVENLMMTVMEYFPFLVNYMDAYGKENYDYLNKVTKVSVLRQSSQPYHIITPTQNYWEHKLRVL